MSTVKPEISLSLEINTNSSSPQNTNQSESIKEEKRGFFSLAMTGRKRTASEAFGKDAPLNYDDTD
jgi:hypothetical protein